MRVSDAYRFDTRGLDGLARYIGEMPQRVERNAARALNKGADSTRTLADKRIRADLNLTARYLSPSEGRLVVSKRASSGHLQAEIFARGEAISLARFVTSGAVGKKGGVTVEVKRGNRVTLQRAFLMRLRVGTSLTADTFNLGLAIRLRPGETIANKTHKVKVMKNGIALLYGPSVEQAFRREITQNRLDDTAADLAQVEFERLMEVL
jgi:hypothetical protein